MQPTELAIELEAKGTIFRAVACKAGERRFRKGRHLEDAWLWESGRWAQHYELQGLKFEDSQGHALAVNDSLSLVAWPESLSLKADIAPSHLYVDGVPTVIPVQLSKNWNEVRIGVYFSQLTQ